ncbi:LPS assembly lipoprotein LptE [Caenispirillum bisanense]|uniref:LPS assembly lipoprotein LptE n=1 Tax=Caenispirillum bisanense TaxID=414052 RepID=UPI0031D0C8C6
MATRRMILRGLAAAGLVSLTAACGYRPLYGGGSRSGAVSAELAKVFVAPIAERYGQIMRNEMEQAVTAAGPSQPKVYTLQVTVARQSRELGILKDATATRANVEMRASFALLKDGKPVLRDTMTSIASYNILDNQYSTIISKEDAESRAARDLAQRIITRVSVHLAGQAQAGG